MVIMPTPEKHTYPCSFRGLYILGSREGDPQAWWSAAVGLGWRWGAGWPGGFTIPLGAEHIGRFFWERLTSVWF